VDIDDGVGAKKRELGPIIDRFVRSVDAKEKVVDSYLISSHAMQLQIIYSPARSQQISLSFRAFSCERSHV
jgi:hypothetical protein